MSSIGNYRIGMQETEAYRWGWKDFENGKPYPDGFTVSDPEFAFDLQCRQLGWDDARRENQFNS
jgi:hypothetical protein